MQKNQEPRRLLERSDRSAPQITIRGMDRKQIIATRCKHREIEKAVQITAIKPTCGIKTYKRSKIGGEPQNKKE